MADRLNPTSDTMSPGFPIWTHCTVRLVKLATVQALAAAHGRDPEPYRLLTFVALHVDNDLDTVVGWGECSALNRAGYTNESAEGAFELLRAGTDFDAGRFPMAASALDMAALDADLRRAGQSLADRLGTTGTWAIAGGVVGLGPLPGVLDQVESLVDQGYRRIKCKIVPGGVTSVPTAVLASFPEVELHVDANGSLDRDDLAEVQALHDIGVTAIEQPFAPGDTESAARLIERCPITVVADEAVGSGDDVAALAFAGAATAVSVKPPRLGGVGAALEVIGQAGRLGLAAAIGGMLESGLGRHVLAALAPLPQFSVVGDLSPARRWLAADPFPDIALRRGRIAAPKRIGIAGDPDLAVLERHTVRAAIVAVAPRRHG